MVGNPDLYIPYIIWKITIFHIWWFFLTIIKDHENHHKPIDGNPHITETSFDPFSFCCHRWRRSEIPKLNGAVDQFTSAEPALKQPLESSTHPFLIIYDHLVSNHIYIYIILYVYIHFHSNHDQSSILVNFISCGKPNAFQGVKQTSSQISPKSVYPKNQNMSNHLWSIFTNYIFSHHPTKITS